MSEPRRPPIRYEVLTDTEYLSTGKVLGFLTNIMTPAPERLEVNGPETLKLVMPTEDDSLIAGDRVIRVVEEDLNVWTEWRVSKIRRRHTDRGAITEVDCLGIKNDMLTFAPIVNQYQANGDRWTHIEWVDLTSTQLWEALWDALGDDPDTLSYFSKGICPSLPDRYDFTLNWETQHSALQELANVLGLEMELEQGSTSYIVNLSTGVNSTVAPVLVTLGKNIIALDYTEDHSKRASRIYPRALGDDAFKPTIGDLLARIGTGSTAVSLFVPTMETDQLKGLWVEQDGRSTRRAEILGSQSTGGPTTTINVSTGSWVAQPGVVPFSLQLGAAGLRAYLRASSGGDRLIYIPRSTAAGKLRSVVLDRRDIPAVTNAYADPVSLGTTGGGPFRVESGTVTSTEVALPTPYVHYGQSAAHITLTSTDASIIFASQVIGGVSSRAPHLSLQTHFYLVRGKVGVQFTVGPFTSSVGSTGGIAMFPSSTVGGENAARASAVETWHDIAIAPGSFDYFEAGFSNYMRGEARFTNLSTGPTELYVDAIQVVNKPVPAEQIVEGSAARKLWDASIALLRSGIDDPAKLYDVQTVDLGRVDPERYPQDRLVQGANITLVEPTLDVVDTRRIKARLRDLTIAGSTKVDLFDA